MHQGNFHYEAVPDDITDFEIVDLWISRKHKNLNILRTNKTLFFTHQGLLYCKKKLCSEGNL